MRHTIVLFAFFLGSLANAQELNLPDVHYPTLPKTGKAIGDFLPKGWKIVAQAKGDINNDAIDDYVVIIQEDNPRNLVKNPEQSTEVMNTNPRVFAAFLGEKNGGYMLGLENHSFIPRFSNPLLSDFIESDALSIARGTFKVWFVIESINSSEVGNKKFTFRLKDQRVELIGFDSSYINRAAQQTSTTSVNFLTKKIKLVCASASSGKAGKTKWGKISGVQAWSIDTIEDALSFDQSGDLMCNEDDYPKDEE